MRKNHGGTILKRFEKKMDGIIRKIDQRIVNGESYIDNNESSRLMYTIVRNSDNDNVRVWSF